MNDTIDLPNQQGCAQTRKNEHYTSIGGVSEN